MALKRRLTALERRPRAPARRRAPDPRLVAALAAAPEPVRAHLHDLHAIGDRAGVAALVDRLVAGEAVEVPAVDWTAEMRALYYADLAPALALGVDAGTLRGLLDDLAAAHRQAPAGRDQRAVRAAEARVRLLLRAAAGGPRDVAT